MSAHMLIGGLAARGWLLEQYTRKSGSSLGRMCSSIRPPISCMACTGRASAVSARVFRLASMLCAEGAGRLVSDDGVGLCPGRGILSFESWGLFIEEQMSELMLGSVSEAEDARVTLVTWRLNRSARGARGVRGGQNRSTRPGQRFKHAAKVGLAPGSFLPPRYAPAPRQAWFYATYLSWGKYQGNKNLGAQMR
jgi:hypothetical protein